MQPLCFLHPGRFSPVLIHKLQADHKTVSYCTGQELLSYTRDSCIIQVDLAYYATMQVLECLVTISLLIFVSHCSLVSTIPFEDFYPHGLEASDEQFLLPNDDGSSLPINLQRIFPFFGRDHLVCYVSNIAFHLYKLFLLNLVLEGVNCESLS